MDKANYASEYDTRCNVGIGLAEAMTIKPTTQLSPHEKTISQSMRNITVPRSYAYLIRTKLCWQVVR